MRRSRNWKWIIITTIIAFGLGALFHFVYEWSDKNKYIGYVFPVNESVWEHLKLAFYPTLLVWLSYFDRSRKGLKLTINERIIGFMTSSLISMIFIVIAFYTLRGAFGIENVWVDISLLVMGIFIGQRTAFQTVKKRTNVSVTLFSWFYMIVFIAVFGYFTFYVPDLPMFYVY